MEAPEPQRAERRARWLLLAIVAAGALLRLLALLQLSELPWWTAPGVDAGIYHRAGQSLAQGEPLGPEALRMSPGYFHFVGAVYAVLGDGPWGLRLVQSALGLATIALLWSTARRLLDDPRWALLPAALAALYGPFIFYEGQILASSLAVFSMTALAWAVTRARLEGGRPLAWALAGLTWGLLTAVRPNAVLLIAPLAFFALRSPPPRAEGEGIEEPRRPPPRARGEGIERTKRLGVLLLAGVLVLLPLSLRSSAIAGEPVLLTVHGGLNLFVGNGPGATGTFRVPEEVPDAAGPAAQFEAFHHAAERARGRTLSVREADAYWLERTVESIADDPLRWIGLIAHKAHLFFDGHELSNVFDYAFARGVIPVLGAPLVQYGWIVPFGLLGIALLLLPPGRAAPAARSLAWLALVFAASVIAVFVVARYRLPVVPVLLLTGTWAVAAIARAARERDRRRLGLLAAGLVAAAAIAWPVDVTKHFEQQWFELGIGWHEQGALERAEGAYRRSLDEDPGFLPSRNNLAVLLERRGRPAAAAEQWRAVARLAREQDRPADLARARAHLEQLGRAPP